MTCAIFFTYSIGVFYGTSEKFRATSPHCPSRDPFNEAFRTTTPKSTRPPPPSPTRPPTPAPTTPKPCFYNELSFPQSGGGGGVGFGSAYVEMKSKTIGNVGANDPLTIK